MSRGAGAQRALTAIATLLLLAAAEATPAPGGDPRSEGEGPGLVGEPLLAIGAVLAIAILAVLATSAWVRLTGGRGGSGGGSAGRPPG